MANQPDFNEMSTENSSIRRTRSNYGDVSSNSIVGNALSYSKKSPSYNPLKKFTGAASRNCFFTPIQCMIQQDVNKYRKLVDTNMKLNGIGGVNKRIFLFNKD